MTPDRIAELRARYPSLAAVGELADEVEHLRKERAGWRSIAGIDEVEAERDQARGELAEARKIARMFLSYTGGPAAAWLSSRRLGTAKLPAWLTDGEADDA